MCRVLIFFDKKRVFTFSFFANYMLKCKVLQIYSKQFAIIRLRSEFFFTLTEIIRRCEVILLFASEIFAGAKCIFKFASKIFAGANSIYYSHSKIFAGANSIYYSHSKIFARFARANSLSLKRIESNCCLVTEKSKIRI